MTTSNYYVLGQVLLQPLLFLIVMAGLNFAFKQINRDSYLNKGIIYKFFHEPSGKLSKIPVMLAVYFPLFCYYMYFFVIRFLN